MLDPRNEMLRDAHANLQAAREKFDMSCRALYPAGAPVVWKRNGHVQHGRILWWAYGDRVRVENARTGGKVFVSSYDIVAVDDD